MKSTQCFFNCLQVKLFLQQFHARECVRNVDLWMQVHPGELRSQNQRVHIVLEASKSAGAKGDILKICGFVHSLHPCYVTHSLACLSGGGVSPCADGQKVTVHK